MTQLPLGSQWEALFDIAAASRSGHDVEIRAALAKIPEYKLRAAQTLDKLSPHYVRGTCVVVDLEAEL